MHRKSEVKYQNLHTIFKSQFINIKYTMRIHVIFWTLRDDKLHNTVFLGNTAILLLLSFILDYIFKNL